MLYELSPEQLNGILRYLNKEEGAAFDPEAAQMIMSMSSAIGAALMKENRRVSGELASCRRRLERIADRNRRKQMDVVEKNEFDCTGLDSLDVARVILGCLQKNGMRISKGKLMLLTYLAYCSYLYHQEKRLFVEAPRAIEGGPIFWRVSKQIETVVTPVDPEVWFSMTKRNPGVAKFLKNYVAKWGDHSEDDLRKFVLMSEPFKTAMQTAVKNGKKACEIDDRDIWLWRESLKK